MRVFLYAPALWRRYGVRGPDGVAEVPDKEAQGFINAGVARCADAVAEPERVAEPVETAEVAPPENAVIRRDKPAPRKKGHTKERK